MTSSRNRVAVAIVVVALLVGAVFVLLNRTGQRTITAYFTAADALYEGNPVEVLGVPVGKIDMIEPQAGRVKVVMHLDPEVKLPASVQAAQIAPSLISGRSIALTPVYDGGPVLADNAVIPIERTQVPLDVNDLYKSAKDLSTALGPDGVDKDGALGRALDVFAANLDGNGEAFAKTIKNLSGATGTLSGSREDLTSTIKALQTFVTTLAQNDPEVRSLSTRLASVSGFLADDRDELASALEELSKTLDDVADFVKDNRQVLRTNVDRLTTVSQVIVRNRKVLGGILDEAPTGLGNLFNSYDAGGGTLDVRLDVNELNLAPAALICELVNRSVPGGLPPAIVTLCAGAAGNLDDLPTLAQLLAALQGSAP